MIREIYLSQSNRC